jgi:uncharacterized membrane protein YkoI
LGRLRHAALLLPALLLAGPTALQAQTEEQDEARQLREAGEILPLQDILSRLAPDSAGRVLSVELEHHHGRYVYEVETLDPRGEVWEHRYDARTGELLKREPED